jgi:nucleotide-binding universal stress UspA family protein
MLAARPVLICYDGSEDARRAIVVAASLLQQRDAVVLDVGRMETVAGDYIAIDPDAMRVDYLIAQDALARARAGAELAREAGFRPEARSDVDARSWSGIVDVADEVDAAVIVIGSRGLSGLKEIVAGSLSHQVTEHARRPVLIAPPPDSRRYVKRAPSRGTRAPSVAVIPHPFGDLADVVRPPSRER